MAKINSYKIDENGNYEVTVKGVSLTDNDVLMLENGFPLNVDFEVVDSRRLSIKQRKKIFALLNDIYNYTGTPQEDLRQMFQFYIETLKGYDTISLADCTMSQAKELIDLIINWVFLHDIPLNYKTSDLMRNDKEFLYVSTINRTCVICGKSKSDLAHLHAVGSGRNRNTIDHRGNYVLALCRNHHGEQHQVGIDSFNDKYHLKNSWVKVDDRLNKMLRGETIGGY